MLLLRIDPRLPELSFVLELMNKCIRAVLVLAVYLLLVFLIIIILIFIWLKDDKFSFCFI